MGTATHVVFVIFRHVRPYFTLTEADQVNGLSSRNIQSRAAILHTMDNVFSLGRNY